MTRARGLHGVAVAAALAIASPAYGQVNFYTQGYFTSSSAACNGVAPVIGAPVSTSCTFAGFTLGYNAAPLNPGPIASGSVVSFGQFTLIGTGNVTVPPPTLAFTLLVRQTMPTVGTGMFTGSITGTVTTDGPNGDFSSLTWRPNSVINIPPSTYELVFDNSGPAAGVGLSIPVNQTRGINAVVTTSTIPEPASVVLLAGGLAAVGLLVRRNRKKLNHVA